MKINNLIIFTHIFFGIAILILIIRVIFFGSCWIWPVLNLAIYLNTWATLERTKERREMQKEINRLKEKHGRNL